jgi:hypothetical protein
LLGRKIPRKNLRIEQRDAQTLSFSLFENNGVFQISSAQGSASTFKLNIQAQHSSSTFKLEHQPQDQT